MSARDLEIVQYVFFGFFLLCMVAAAAVSKERTPDTEKKNLSKVLAFTALFLASLIFTADFFAASLKEKLNFDYVAHVKGIPALAFIFGYLVRPILENWLAKIKSWIFKE